MYTAGATASAQGEALPTKQVIFPARESRIASMARDARSVIPEFTDLCTDVILHHHAGHVAGPRRREEVRTMQFGVMLPHRWLYAAGNTIADFAREAEALGYTSLWVTDHIIVPSYRTERGHIFYEALTTLAYVSSITTRCRLGVAVLALPPRNAVLVAKQVATLDALSQGRVLLGVGTGWIEEELRYLGATWQQRGAMLDEAIQVLRTLWSDDAANSFAGRYTTFADIACFPKPAQSGGPKVLVGGMTAPSLRRAATLGDGWIPWAVSPQELKDGVDRIRAYGGNRALELVCVMPADIGAHAMERYVGVFGEDHKLLSGSVTTVARMVEAFEKAGLHHLVCSFRDVRLFRDERIDEINRQMRLFAQEVLPSFVG
jgi:probable F420-dependent oxidoreductase